MRKVITFSSLLLLFFSCKNAAPGISVDTAEALQEAISNAKPGDEIVMANGVWKDVQIRFTGEGTEEEPIKLRAETPGKVFIEGQSDLKIGGKYLEVEGLHFQNGFTPSQVVIEFRIDKKQLAYNCSVTNCVIENYNQLKRDRQDLWVEFSGRHNRLDRCYLAGKSNQGPTVRVDIKGNQSIRNFHQITNNHFGPRPRKGGPKAETIQLGGSSTSMSPSNTLVANNLFERCNGEVEVISSKTNFNEFRNNVFYKCEGALVTRHGNYCIIDGNYFIGDETANIGGARIINTGHWLTNNYFYSLRGTGFNSPLAMMNGIPKSPLNRYNQVTDVVVAHNTWVNCESPWHFGIGSNIAQKDVLPKSEIRSAVPIRTTIANNLIYNEKGDPKPIVEHDKIDKIKFENNLIHNAGTAFAENKGLKPTDLKMTEIAENIFAPSNKIDSEIYAGFDFETIEKDLLGNDRSKTNSVGAIAGNGKARDILNYEKYGPSWFSTEKEMPETKRHELKPGDDLAGAVKNANSGDVIELANGIYNISTSLKIDKTIRITSKDESGQKEIIYSGAENTPLFEMNPKGNLVLQDVLISGTGSQFAFATLKKNMSSLYNLNVNESEISNFKYVLKAYKESFADEIAFGSTKVKNCQNGIELSQETNDKGDYNVEFLSFDACRFENISANVIDYYRGGYDESTIGGNLFVTDCTFTNCGAGEENKILLNHRGIINVDISKNTFKNNPVKLVAVLWGAKNNTHSENEIVNSGELRVQENLKLKLMY